MNLSRVWAWSCLALVCFSSLACGGGSNPGNGPAGGAGVPAGGRVGNGGSSVGGAGPTAGSGVGGSAAGNAPGAGAAGGPVSNGGTPGAAGSDTGGSNSVGGSAGGVSAGSGGTSGGTGGLANGGGNAAGSPAEPYPVPATPPANETGAELWLRYKKVVLPRRLAEYQAALTHVVRAGTSATLQAAQAELVRGLTGLLGAEPPVSADPTGNGALVLGTPESSALVRGLALGERLTAVGSEGYLIQTATVGANAAIVIAGNTDVGVLRGAFALLRHLQSYQSLQGLSLSGAPKIQRRLLNHWDNMDGTVERGYAGRSLWSWSSLPATLSQRYTDYARANASIGINGTVLNNVNSNAQILNATNLDRVAALAGVFRTYGIKVYLSARFSAPIEIGGLTTADPLSMPVRQWWATKAQEIYTKIPDFGGFLVKANSEGQPGPQDYSRTHADGAKMLSDALAPHGGIVLWRAFVYATSSTDRIRQAYDEFKPLDGSFGTNAMVQVKNGPLDFQPREPFSPLFGAMPRTPLALELQITKEYLGQDTHLAYLGPLFEEVLKADTQGTGQGPTVSRVIDGSAHSHMQSAISGVANIGADTNWTGSHFNQANWYAFGRMAWDPNVSAASVAEEWIRMTLSNDPAVVKGALAMMMESHQAVVDYMTPLGLVHIMGTDHHYGPAPWVNNLSQANWNPFYYHKADRTGIGFDRTAAGSNAVSQYSAMVREQFGNRMRVPQDFLLFFHRVGWDEMVGSRTLWNELVHRYSSGVDAVGKMREEWNAVQGRIDTRRYDEISDFLEIQHYEARWWRDASLRYFASVSGKTIPSGYAMPARDLAYYQSLAQRCPSDVTKPRCPDIYTGTPSPAVLPQ